MLLDLPEQLRRAPAVARGHGLAQWTSMVRRSTASLFFARAAFPFFFLASLSMARRSSSIPCMHVSYPSSIISSNISRAPVSSMSGIISLLLLVVSASRSSSSYLYLRPRPLPDVGVPFATSFLDGEVVLLAGDGLKEGVVGRQELVGLLHALEEGRVEHVHVAAVAEEGREQPALAAIAIFRSASFSSTRPFKIAELWVPGLPPFWPKKALAPSAAQVAPDSAGTPQLGRQQGT